MSRKRRILIGCLVLAGVFIGVGLLGLWRLNRWIRDEAPLPPRVHPLVTRDVTRHVSVQVTLEDPGQRELLSRAVRTLAEQARADDSGPLSRTLRQISEEDPLRALEPFLPLRTCYIARPTGTRGDPGHLFVTSFTRGHQLLALFFQPGEGPGAREEMVRGHPLTLHGDGTTLEGLVENHWLRGHASLVRSAVQGIEEDRGAGLPDGIGDLLGRAEVRLPRAQLWGFTTELSRVLEDLSATFGLPDQGSPLRPDPLGLAPSLQTLTEGVAVGNLVSSDRLLVEAVVRATPHPREPSEREEMRAGLEDLLTRILAEGLEGRVELEPSASSMSSDLLAVRLRVDGLEGLLVRSLQQTAGTPPTPSPDPASP